MNKKPKKKMKLSSKIFKTLDKVYTVIAETVIIAAIAGMGLVSIDHTFGNTDTCIADFYAQIGECEVVNKRLVDYTHGDVMCDYVFKPCIEIEIGGETYMVPLEGYDGTATEIHYQLRERTTPIFKKTTRYIEIVK